MTTAINIRGACMKAKVWVAVLGLLSATHVFAAAQVEERELKRNAVESAQLKAEFARKQAIDAEQQVRAAEQEVAEAERADQEARQRASAAASRLEQARARLSRAQASRAAASTSSERAVDEVNKEWSQRERLQ